jgi:hypothetical protein
MVWCCEFGAGDGISISNTYNLRLNGWKSVLIEGNEIYRDSLDLLVKKSINETYAFTRFVTCEPNETLDDILSETTIPLDFDLLSIDIDGNDLYVWKSLKKYKPKVVIIEYNNCFPSEWSLTIKYDPKHVFNNDSYYGATAGALVKVAHEKGYTLVAYTQGLNLVFCLNEFSHNFTNVDYTKIKIENGHPPSNKNMVEY